MKMADGIELQAEEKHELTIYEEKTYKDPETGMTVIEQVPVESQIKSLGLLDARPAIRFGKAHIPTQMGVMPFSFKFPPEFSLVECFERFEECAQAALDQLEKEAQNQIIIPKGINANDLRV